MPSAERQSGSHGGVGSVRESRPVSDMSPTAKEARRGVSKGNRSRRWVFINARRLAGKCSKMDMDSYFVLRLNTNKEQSWGRIYIYSTPKEQLNLKTC